MAREETRIARGRFGLPACALAPAVTPLPLTAGAPFQTEMMMAGKKQYGTVEKTRAIVRSMERQGRPKKMAGFQAMKPMRKHSGRGR